MEGWLVAAGFGATTVLFGLRLAVVSRDKAFWKHHAIVWRKTAKTYYAQRTQKNWSQVEQDFRTWEPPHAA